MMKIQQNENNEINIKNLILYKYNYLIVKISILKNNKK